ncbi:MULTISPECIES: UDP-N-acetylmuramate--L-alanine ligase [Dermabacter]|uniref:UDP-N-acetylmuramate--L-alanine ligase n=1 Tax=Dermabacter TaxID=36739 RepID=UPI0021A8804F|nr:MULTISPECIES: UDP-N-acetylmuramate--L-alanine ligase [Dermabacter]MCT1956157.1 UDP-N-acetylmuramate--L-alanine ligase [Dermabacter hominis]MDU1464316.1 UDP-N-acetylmuramate--L-alanine ligase [Dermabacter sp.]
MTTSSDFLSHLRPFSPGEVRTMLRPGAVVTAAAWPEENVRKIHVIRIGGAGMSAVARLALEASLEVTGSESQEGRFLPPLRELGARITVGFDADSVEEDTDLVIVSTAVRADNPEVRRAHELSIPVIHRAAGLAGLLGEHAIIAVAGTHGKTTTSAMATLALRAAGAEPAWAVGAAVAQLGANASQGAGEYAVVEADESDGSFVAFAPSVLVLTNFEADHLDFHGTEQNLRAVLSAFAARLSETNGTLVACADDPGAHAFALDARDAGLRVVLYGEHPEATWRIVADHSNASGAHVQVVAPNGQNVDLALRVPGRHNVLNALGVLAALDILGIERESALGGLAEFEGADRRFQVAGEVNDVAVIDDYAHHPREVAAALAAGRERAEGGRLVAVFQPHLFSRTKAFTREFAEALSLADEAVLLPIYPAREDFDPSIRSEDIAALVDGGARVLEAGDVPNYLAEHAHDARVILMMGAGDIVDVSPRVLEALKARGA